MSVWSRRTLMFGAGAAALSACAPAKGLKPIRVGVQKSGVPFLAKARGGLDVALKDVASAVQWVEFPSGPPMIEAMAAGAVDFGLVGESPPVFAQAAGAPIVYVAAQPVTGAGSALLVPRDSPLKSVAELKGKRVAFTKASSAHLFVVEALKQAGLTLADIQPIQLSPGDAAGAFASGAIDAWSTWDPYYALAQRDQQARALVTGERLPRTSSFYIATRSFAEGSPDALKALLAALKTHADWGQAHRDQVARIIAAATGLPADIAQAALRRGRYAVDPLDDAILAGQQQVADTFHAIGAIPKAIRVRDAAWLGWKG